MDTNRPDSGKLDVTRNSGNYRSNAGTPPMTYSDPVHHTPPSDSSYRYPGEYMPVENRNKNKNLMFIALGSCLAILVGMLIVLCVLFFTKFSGDDTKTTKGKANTSVAEEIEEEPEEIEEEIEKVEFVTYISDARIFVRSGPGTNYSKLMAINGSDRSVRLEYTGNSQVGSDGYTWYEVNVPTGGVGWVRSDIVVVYSGPSTPIRASVKPKSTSYSNASSYLVTRENSSSIYVRSGPGKSYSILRKIAPGDTSVRLAYNGYSQYGQDGYIWYSVTLPNGSSAWVRSDIVRWL